MCRRQAAQAEGPELLGHRKSTWVGHSWTKAEMNGGGGSGPWSCSARPICVGHAWALLEDRRHVGQQEGFSDTRPCRFRSKCGHESRVTGKAVGPQAWEPLEGKEPLGQVCRPSGKSQHSTVTSRGPGTGPRDVEITGVRTTMWGQEGRQVCAERQEGDRRCARFTGRRETERKCTPLSVSKKQRSFYLFGCFSPLLSFYVTKDI